MEFRLLAFPVLAVLTLLAIFIAGWWEDRNK